MKMFKNICYGIGILVAMGLVAVQTSQTAQNIGGQPCTGTQRWYSCADVIPVEGHPVYNEDDCKERHDHLYNNNVNRALASAGAIPNGQCTSVTCNGSVPSYLYDTCCTPE